MNSGIYTITHRDSGTRYVGSSVNLRKRWLTHIRELKAGVHRCSHLQRAVNKYGMDAFVFELVEAVVPERTPLLEAEQRWMDSSGRLYNTCKIAGSPAGYRHTEQAKNAIADALTGKAKTPEHVEASRQARMLVPRNKEQDERFARNRLGTTQTSEHKAKRVAAANATKALRTPEQNEETRIKRCRARGWTVTINEVEYLSYRDAEQKLGISRYRLEKDYPRMSPTVLAPT